MPLKLKKYKNSPNWKIRGTYKGHYINQTTGTPDKGLAEAELGNVIQEINNATFNRGRKTYTFGEAALSYRECGGSARYLGEFEHGAWDGVIGQFLDVPLADIDQKELDAAANRVYPNVKPQTLDRQFYTPFIAVWNHGFDKKMCPLQRWSRPEVRKADKKRRPWFRKPEIAGKVLFALPWHLKALFLFMLYTGARPTEAVEMDIENLFLDEQWAVLDATKTDALRGVPLRPLVVRALRWYIGDRTAGRVFLTYRGKPYKSRRGSDGTVQGSGYFKTSWRHAMASAGLTSEGYQPYSCRHTFNNWLIKAGVDKETREALMGHDDESTNAIYSDVPRETFIQIVSALPDCTDFEHLPPLNPSLFTYSPAVTEAAIRMREIRKDKKIKGFKREKRQQKHDRG